MDTKHQSLVLWSAKCLKELLLFFFFFLVGSYIIYCTCCIQLSVTTNLRVIFTHSATCGLIILVLYIFYVLQNLLQNTFVEQVRQSFVKFLPDEQEGLTTDIPQKALVVCFMKLFLYMQTLNGHLFDEHHRQGQ